MDKARPGILALAGVLLALPFFAADFYVSPAGSASSNGSASQPWDLSTALAHPSAVKPGDTIWVRGGTYTGHFRSTLRGIEGKPIVVRAYPGERATIDGNYGGNEVTLVVNGAYTWFWGLEITNSDPERVSATTSKPPLRGEGLQLLARGGKLINLVVHDTAQGVLTTAQAPDGEVYGCLFYYNGWDSPDRGHGHGVYVQNETGFKRVADNVIFRQFGIGVHGYTETGQLVNIAVEGNTVFENGVLSEVTGPTMGILVGANGSAADGPDASTKVAKKTKIVSNLTYFSGSSGTGVNLGFSKGTASPILVDNYLAGGEEAVALVNAFRPITMTGNTVFGGLAGFESSEFPSNAYLSTRPTGNRVFVRPNQYEKGRANITVFNWARSSSVGVSLKGILEAGTQYEIRNAQNYFGPPVLSGTYDGSSTLALPMNGLAPAAPVGVSAPPSTGPDFQVFVVVPKAPASLAKPPAAAFSFSPRAPLVGQPVTFTDMTAGAADTVAWSFGDPESGGENVSSLESPVHTFDQAGTYTVRLTASNAGGATVRTRDVTVTSSPGTRAATLPVAGHVLGATGSVFLTDVAVENPTTASVTANLVFTPTGGGPPLQSALTLAPGETRLLTDVVASEFGEDNAIGSLRVDTQGQPPSTLRVASRTYVRDGDSTLGLGTVGLGAADAATGDRYLSNLAVNDAFRTNVGALNISGDAQVFLLELLEPSGSVVGRTALSLEAGAQKQWGLATLFPLATGSGLTARIIPVAGAVAPLAYAAVTDNASSDPTYYPALGPAPVHYVPGIAGISGVGGAFFRSEIAIANSGSGPAKVTVTFLEHDRDNSNPPTASFVLAPRETLHAEDALDTLFGVTETYGALRIESDTSPGVTVFERILTDATSTAGTVGQQVDAVPAENVLSTGSLLGVRQDDAFRTNVGLVNASTVAALVALRLIRSPASELGTASVLLPPRGYVQRNLAALFPGAELPEGEVLSISVDGGGKPVFAFASVIDNVSQDPTYYPELP